jgi:CheY-like chemotaxis protein
MLEEAGASVVTAKDGKQALKEYLDRPSGSFDAVLMDIMMPVMDGYETAKAIRTCGREDGETIPIIAATACVSEEARQKCAQAGMNEFLEKPLELERTVKTLLYFIK